MTPSATFLTLSIKLLRTVLGSLLMSALNLAQNALIGHKSGRIRKMMCYYIHSLIRSSLAIFFGSIQGWFLPVKKSPESSTKKRSLLTEDDAFLFTIHSAQILHYSIYSLRDPHMSSIHSTDLHMTKFIFRQDG